MTGFFSVGQFLRIELLTREYYNRNGFVLL